MDEVKPVYLRSCIQILKYSQLGGNIFVCLDSNRPHKLMLKMKNLCQKGSEHSSILEDYLLIMLEFRKGQLE